MLKTVEVPSNTSLSWIRTMKFRSQPNH